MLGALTEFGYVDSPDVSLVVAAPWIVEAGNLLRNSSRLRSRTIKERLTGTSRDFFLRLRTKNNSAAARPISATPPTAPPMSGIVLLPTPSSPLFSGEGEGGPELELVDIAVVVSLTPDPGCMTIAVVTIVLVLVWVMAFVFEVLSEDELSSFTLLVLSGVK